MRRTVALRRPKIGNWQIDSGEQKNVQYWSDILGHQRVLGVLSRAIDADRLHHAYLFTGPPGVGKFATARALAAVLNCEKRTGEAFAPSCNKCTSCRRIASTQHPDVLHIEPTGKSAKTLKIDQIRTLQRASISAPYEGRYRVVLIDDAHLMTEEAANALLKTLEEPPPRMMLLVITDQPHRLLPTIISRCQQVRFGSLDLDTVAAALPGLLARASEDDEDVEEIEGDPTLFPIAAGYGEGSLGRSLSMLQSGMLEGREEFLKRVLRLDPRSSVAWLDAASKLADSPAHLEERLDVLTVFFRDLMLFKEVGATRLVNSDLVDLVAEAAPKFSTEAILAILDALLAAQSRLAYNVSGQLLAEDLLDRLRHPDTKALMAPA